MVFSNATPYPYTIQPLSNISPFTYRDGITYLEKLERMRQWLNDTLVPDFNAGIANAIAEFQTGIQNSVNDVIATRDEWDAFFNAFMANIEAELKALNDSAVGALVGDPVSVTGSALRKNFAPVVSPLSYGAVGDGVTVDAVAIQAAVNATPPGGTLLFPPSRVFALGAGQILVSTSITIRGGEFTTTTGKAFKAIAPGVVFDRLKITGQGTANPYVAGNPGISIQGTSDVYISGTVKNCEILGMVDTGIRLEYVRDFRVTGNTVNGFRYGGIMVNSGDTGIIHRNRVMHAVQDTVGLSYGIAVTDLINEVAHRSRNVDVSFNYVEDVPLWEGIDVHGGKNVAVNFNTVKECKSGIVFTVGSNTRLTAPEQCRAIGNHVSAPTLMLTTTCSGVALGGSGTTHPLHPLWTDAVVTGNSLFDVTIPVNLPTSTGATVDRKKSLIANNASNLKVIDSRDTGWVDATLYGTFSTGYTSNSTYPVKIRIVGDVVKFEGVVSLTADARLNNVFFVLNDATLIPTFDRIMGVGQGVSTPYERFTLSVNTAGSYRTVFPTTTPTTNFTVTGEYQL